MSQGTFSVEPIISFPPEAVVGQTYLITVDLRATTGWPFPEEEYPVYCIVDGGARFTSQAVGAGAVVLHRFGGTYGPAQFLVKVEAQPGAWPLLINLLSGWGAPLGRVPVTIKVVAQSDHAAPRVQPVREPVVRGNEAPPKRAPAKAPRRKERAQAAPTPVEVRGLRLTIGVRSGEMWPVIAERIDSDGRLVLEAEGALPSDLAERLRSLFNRREDAGRVLGQLLFREAVGNTYAKAVESVRNSGVGRLRLQLLIEDEALAELPWEQLMVPFESQLVPAMTSGELSFALLVEPADREGPSYATLQSEALRALVVVASPRELASYGLMTFDSTAALAPIRSALGVLPSRILASDGEFAPSLAAIRQEIERDAPAILHLSCYSRTSSDRNDVALFLAASSDPQRVALATSAQLIETLGRLRATGRLPRLVVLSSPPNSTASGHSRFARRLIQALDTPAVITIEQQSEVAERMIGVLYQRLLEHGDIVRAFAEAITSPYDPPLGVALYTSTASSALLFDVHAVTPGEPAEAATGSTRSPSLVFVTGQSGTGGELLAPLGVSLDGTPLLTIDAATAASFAKEKHLADMNKQTAGNSKSKQQSRVEHL